MGKLKLSGYGQNQSAIPSSIAAGANFEGNPYAPPLSDAREIVASRGVASDPAARKIGDRPEPGVCRRMACETGAPTL